MADIFSVGITALNAFKQALAVTANNIANANTPNFSRRDITLSSDAFGTGVNVSDVQLVFDQGTAQFAQQTTSEFNQVNTFLTQLQNFEPLFDDPSTNVGKYINDTFTSLTNLNANASSTVQRNLFLNSLSNLQQRFQNVAAQIDQQRQNINKSITSAVGEANQILGTIANLNLQIANTPTNEAIDLVDARQAQVQELAKYFNFSANLDSNNNMVISLSNGLNLVEGTTNATFTTAVSSVNANENIVAIKNGATNIDVTNFISGGEVAGFLNFRSQALDASERALNRCALAISQSLNNQNKMGIDLNGNFGTNIFTDINTSGLQGSRVIANTSNGGSSVMSVAVNDLTKLTTSDYTLAVNAGNTYTITRISDGVSVSSGLIDPFPQNISFDGVTLTITSGTFNQGDHYTLSPTNQASQSMLLQMNPLTDSGKLAMAWPVAAKPVMPQQQGSTGYINVTGITDPSNAAFATSHALSPPILLKFVDSTHYSLYNATTSALIEGPIAYSPSPTQAIFPTPGGYDPGYRVALGGTCQTGDQFNIDFNSEYTNDNRNGELMSGLYTKGILDSSTNTFNQAYNLASLGVSLLTQQSQLNYNSSQALNQSAMDAYQSISGVDLEEESINLVQYQQAYQASAQVLQIAKSVFATIISAIG